MNDNFIMMSNGDVYYFEFGNHEQHLSTLAKQYGLSHLGSDGYGLINEYEWCEEHSILSVHGADTFNYGSNGLTNEQHNALSREVALGHIDSHLVRMINGDINYWKDDE